jgi:pSer/pThr/pTyr-binding forkhead associated (FHA) protein
MSSIAGRAAAARVAKWLVEKGRTEDAVAALSAWATKGPNDNEGQQLLAEALRIEPRSETARMAFERMEGISGYHAPLDEAITRWTEAELAGLEKEIARPSFRKAQVGFNNNLKYKSAVFHVQTEDSGLDRPHIVTHLFADGGRIIKSVKRSYSDAVSRPDVALYVRQLMKGQQLEMILALRDGHYDRFIEGKESGGTDVLEHPPDPDLKRLAGKKKPAAAAARSEPTPAPPSAAARFHLHVMRSLSGGPEIYEAAGEEVVIGSQGQVPLAGEQFCHPREAVLRWKAEKLWLEDIEGGNGVFLRIRRPVQLEFGDEFIVGDQLLRVVKNPQVDDGPDPTPTYFWSSPKGPSSFRVVQIFEGGAEGACIVARDTTVQIGSAFGEMVFKHDPLISELHCGIDEQAGIIVLTDLESRTGVFVRIEGEQEVAHGDELLIGRTRLVVDLSPSQRA